MESTGTTSSYVHKKFAAQKRKRSEVDEILEQSQERMTTEVPPCKRRQLKGLFRPWLDNEEQQVETSAANNSSSTPTTTTTTTTNNSLRISDLVSSKPSTAAATALPLASTYHANMVRQSHKAKQRSPKEQQRRDRNTLACLLSRRARQAQEALMAHQYEQYRAQQAAVFEQQIRLSLYYRQLLEQAVFQQGVSPVGVALPQQQQQFLQGMSLSQQLMMFGPPY